jgi:hypothetical protein
MQTDETKIDSDLAFAEYVAELTSAWHENHYLIASHRTGKQRTLTQNRALHLWLGMVARILNAAGLDMRKVLKPEVDIPWTTETIKEFIWRPVQEAVISKESTVDADRNEYTKVYDVLVRHLGEKLGVAAPAWPKKKDADQQQKRAA